MTPVLPWSTCHSGSTWTIPIASVARLPPEGILEVDLVRGVSFTFGVIEDAMREWRG